MKRLGGVWLWAVIALSTGACYQSVDLTELGGSGGGGSGGGETPFTGTGTLEDCSQWAPKTYQVANGSQYDGVDLLVVVDNSRSMAQEQLILSTGFFTLINSLTKPLLTDPNWGYDAVENMRVAVVSSDLGLMYGENHDTALSPAGVPTCDMRLSGDDGNFLQTPAGVWNIEVNDNVIACEAGGGQCPDGWVCNLNAGSSTGVCKAPGVTTVGCGPAISGEYASTAKDVPNAALSTQVACMAQQGTLGCGFEQQLEASLYSLRKHPDFIVESHLLAVLIVSDEEDCSIMDPSLFGTTEWLSATEHNIACNANAVTESNLFPTSRYVEGLKALKHGMSDAVIFAAIVGVPTAAESARVGLPLCEGRGDEIPRCLDAENVPMQMVPMQFVDPPTGSTYTHFRPACQREDPTSPGTYVTEACPGRRYVAAAAEFGANSFVYSICNPNWSPAMVNIAAIIAGRVSRTCFGERLEWKMTPSNQQPAYCADGNCGESDCNLAVRIVRGINESEECPAELYASLSEAERAMYEDKKEVVSIENPVTGVITHKNIDCLLPKLPAPLDCDSARMAVDHSSVGWYYCEEASENFENACNDGIDNDGDGAVDSADIECAPCVSDPVSPDCNTAKCNYNVEITEAGKTLVSGNTVSLYCLGNSELGSEECSSTTNAALGSPCIQPGDSLVMDGLYYPSVSKGVEAVSFQKGCDCMTYNDYRGMADVYTNHFCTGSCSTANQDCPSGFTCIDVFTDSYNRPDGLARSYCVPSCFLPEDCPGIDQQCVPSSESGVNWECQSI